MKKQLFTLVLLLALAITGAHAQLKIGDNPLVIDPDAILHMEVTAQNKGVLLPRVTTATRPAADASNAGMIVYNTTTGTTQYCNGTVWQDIGAGTSLWVGSGNNIYNTNTGNVGIGTTTPADKLHINSGNFRVVNEAIFTVGMLQNFNSLPGSNPAFVTQKARGSLAAPTYVQTGDALGQISFRNHVNNGPAIVTYATENHSATQAGSNFTFFTIPNGTNATVERMRIEQNGRVGIGTSAPDALLTVAQGNNDGGNPGLYVARVATVSAAAAWFLNTSNIVGATGIVIRAGSNSAAGGTQILFQRGGDAANIGSITQSTLTTVAYNTSSDRRLKENFRPSAHGLSTILKLNVLDYNYIGDPTLSTGLIAQEAYEVVPSVVHQGSDDAKKDPWSIDYGKLTPYLIKAVQEQQVEIEALKAENAALKAQAATAVSRAEYDELKAMVTRLLENGKEKQIAVGKE